MIAASMFLMMFSALAAAEAHSLPLAAGPKKLE